jgi:hypothetical protein
MLVENDGGLDERKDGRSQTVISVDGAAYLYLG